MTILIFRYFPLEAPPLNFGEGCRRSGALSLGSQVTEGVHEDRSFKESSLVFVIVPRGVPALEYKVVRHSVGSSVFLSLLAKRTTSGYDAVGHEINFGSCLGGRRSG
jgi:hypothetical protein